MSTKEFVNNQVEKFSTPLTPEQFTELTEAENSLIILEVPIHDYTLTEIAKLVEDNNARIIDLSSVLISGGEIILVSIKIDVSDISAIIRSFVRFDYNIIYYFMKEGEITDKQKDRLDELLYYLDM